MDWDDSYDEEWDDASGYRVKDYGSYGRSESSETDDLKDDFDPTDITNPASAYFFLSDDVQDEIEGAGRKRMKCTSCGHLFKAETFDPCPKCGSYLTEESSFTDGNEETDGENMNMKCLNCGHRFVGDTFDQCPKCESYVTEESFFTDEDEDTDGEKANMKCLSCGHQFSGDIFDHCPECFSSDSESITKKNFKP